MAEYYRQRAGAGLIISEGVAVSKKAIGYMNTPGLFTDDQVQGWKKVTSSVHQAGGWIFAQLWHVGSVSHPDFHGGDLPIAPSDVNPGLAIRTPGGRKMSVSPRPMTEEEITETVTDFRDAAVRAMESGFDGIEIHSSNGYLFHQFFSTSTNLRTDRYGGSRENRTRFFFEVLDAILTRIPPEKVAARLNPMYHGRVGIQMDKETLPTFESIVHRLNGYRLAYLHMSRPLWPIDSPFLIRNVPAHFRKLTKGHFMVNAGYDRDSAEDELVSGHADSVAFGIPYISNPDLPERFRHGHPLQEADKTKYYSSGPRGYTTYKAFGEE
jgi:N-ethylmaleimide reductase